MANPSFKDPESQRANAIAGRKTRKRVNKTALEVLAPEEEDALALQSYLGTDLVKALARSVRELPPGEQFDAARRSTLLSVQARHDLIVRLISQGMNKTRVSRAVGVTNKTVDEVVSSYFSRKELDLRNKRMDEFVLVMAEGYLEDIDRLTDIIQRSTHATAVVGAIKARQEARQKYIDLLADFGFITRKPTEVHITGDGATVDARTQNVIVVDASTIKSLAKDMLKQRRLEKGEPTNEAEDERISQLVINADDIN